MKQYIIDPLKGNDTKKGAENLRTLLASCYLRRKSAVLAQPIAVTENRRFLEMSIAEKTRYQKARADCEKVVSMLVCSKQASKCYITILQTITYLRLFCNHGVSLPPPQFGSSGPQTNMASEEVDVIEDPVDLLDSFEAMGKATCAACEAPITSLSEMASAGRGYLTRCSHLLCGLCFPEKLITAGKATGHNQYYCHLCGETSRGSHLYIFPNGVMSSMVDRLQSPGVAQSVPVSSTKVMALITDIQDNPARQKRYEMLPLVQVFTNRKCYSIVFSGWRKTLDVVQKCLEDCGISFRRLDGTVDSARREEILGAFRADPDVLVLLMTTGCGAVG